MLSQAKVSNKRKHSSSMEDEKDFSNLHTDDNHPSTNILDFNSHENSDIEGFDDSDVNSVAAAETISCKSGQSDRAPITTDLTSKDRSVTGVGHSRVKVKLKSSTMNSSQATCSELHTPSDTDRSGLQAASEKQEESIDMKADEVYSVAAVFGISSKKVPQLKFTASSSSAQRAGALLDGPNVKNSSQSGLGLNNYEQHRRQKELNTALAVIKKIMRMEAAEPFNAPVDPVALGVPDYFDVIATPMDFGTICSNIERGIRYINTDDILKDVQVIWDNCYMYNNKGDYILELMKRVKKNLTKYWVAAGLHYEPVKRNAGMSSNQGQSLRRTAKQKKKARHRIDLHKSDCMCAVCVVRRRKRERFVEVTENETASNDQADLANELKQEEDSSSNYPYSEEGSPVVEQSVGLNVEGDADEQGIKWEIMRDGGSEHNRQLDIKSASDMELSRQVLPDVMVGNKLEQTQDERYAAGVADQQTNSPEMPKEEEVIHCGPSEVLQDKCHQLDPVNVSYYVHPSTMDLCSSLFPADPKSVWRGPHSLMHVTSPVRDNPLYSVIAMFMK